MTRDRLKQLRNIGIAAHIDAGKTTLTERILFLTGKSHRLGETHTGTSQMDTMKQEIAKGITISSAATHTSRPYEDQAYAMNIIDTPGHVDFTIEVERSLRVLDGMVALFDAVAGVEPQTETVWRQAARYQIPVIAMVNKMDRLGADFFAVVQQIRDRFGVVAVPLQIPFKKGENFEGVIDLIEKVKLTWNADGTQMERQPIPQAMLPEVERYRSQVLESIAILDEALFDRYIEQPASISEREWKQQLRKQVLDRRLVPVLMGAAYKNKGIQPLLDAICAYLPAPEDRPPVEGILPQTEAATTRQPLREAPFSGLAFKIVLDQQNRQLCFFRVYSGRLAVGDVFFNPRTQNTQRISRLYQMHANKRKEIRQVVAGDIAAMVGFREIRTGDTLCDPGAPLVLESLVVPPPVIQMSIEPQSNAYMDKLSMALAKLQLEDPSFKVKTDQETGQTIMLGMGELHLEIIVDKLQDDFGVPVQMGAPAVTYREQFTQSVQTRHRLRKQRGGKGLFAEMEVRLGPADEDFLNRETFQEEGERLQFINQIVGGSIPKEFIPAIAQGFRRELENGPLAGYPVESLKVELLDGDTHSKDSNPVAFEICAMEALRSVREALAPQLLEPIGLVTVTTPAEYLGNILGGLNRRRGIILSQEVVHQHMQVTAEVPLAELFGYISHLRSVSAGRGNFTMQFGHYAPLPAHLAAPIIAAHVT
jgi:elongation factor G